MNEKLISSLVLISVLAVAGIGMYIFFVAEGPSEGRSIEGAKTYYELHQPYEAYGSMYLLAEKLKDAPKKEFPAGDLWDSGFCVLMFNPRSASIIPVPVGRHTARGADQSETVQIMLDRDWVVVDVTLPQFNRICPAPEKVPTLIELMEKYKV